MTDLTYPSEAGGVNRRHHASHAVQKAGGHTGYVVSGPDISRWESGLDEHGVSAFTHVETSGLDLTIGGGEAYVGGWLCRDVETTITVPSGTTSTVAVGFNLDAVLGDGEAPGDSENIILDTTDAFSTDDPRVPLYEVTAGTSSVSSVSDVRPLGRENAQAPWVNIETVEGPFTVESDTYRDHLHIDRPSVGSWSVGPTTNGAGGGSLEVERRDGGESSTFRFTGDNNLFFSESNEYAVKSDEDLTIKVGEDESNAGDYDIFFEVR